MSDLSFIDQANLPEATNFDPLPAGDYAVQIDKAEVKDTKAGTGKYIALTLRVTTPSHAGRLLFPNMNIKNQSEKAQEIGLQQFGSLKRALGLEYIPNTEALIGGQLTVKVKIKNDEMRGQVNEVSGYKALDGVAQPPIGIPANPPKAGPKAMAGATPPWGMKK